MNKEKLQKVLENHRLWFFGEGGECADLRDADLSYAMINENTAIFRKEA